jgi:cell division FtsZ-interacting protein ZapD
LNVFAKGDIRSEFEAELAKEREEAERRQEEEERQSRELAGRLAQEEQETWRRTVSLRNSQTLKEGRLVS